MKIPLRDYWQLLVRYLRPQWARATVLGVLLLGSIGLQLVNPQILTEFVDGIQAGAPSRVLFRAAAVFLVIAVVQQVMIILTTYVGENVGWTATNALRTDLLAHTVNLDLGFHKAHTPGELIERIDGDVTALTNFFSQFVIQVLGNALLIVGVVAVLAWQDWRLGLVVGCFAAGSLAALIRLRNIAVPHWAAEREATATFFGFLEERLAGTEDIRANGGQPYVLRRFYELMRDQLRKSLKAGWMVNIVLNVGYIAFALGTAGGFAVSATLFRRQVVTIGAVFLVYRYTQMLEQPLRTITYQLQQLQRAGAGIGRVRALLAVRKQLTEVSDTEAAHLPAGALGVRFDGVTFAYHDAAPLALPSGEDDGHDVAGAGPAPEAAAPEAGEPEPAAPDIVLRDITFDLAPGTVLGLLGRTGSGKTTLTRLLLRFYDPDAGAVRLTGGGSASVDLRDLPLTALRKHVGIVTQEIQLFNATVRDNLTFFDPAIPDARICEVIDELGLTPWLASLPQGLDTVLESGGGLSAGEAQLLAFTRIFLQDPGLVLLDEASSRLDPATEQRIERAVDKLLQNRTAVIIAHRLGTVQRADEILILEEGGILERGDRAALAAEPASHFYRLLKAGLEEVMV